MDQKNVTLLIAGFIAMIIGISLIAVVASEGNKKTEIATATSEVIDLSSARESTQFKKLNITNYTLANQRTSWKLDEADCAITAVLYTNGSSTFTENTDYKVYQPGIFEVIGTTETNGTLTNTTYFTYTYCPDEYITQSWERTVLDLVPGFFAMAILLIGVALVFQVLRNEGLINI